MPALPQDRSSDRKKRRRPPAARTPGAPRHGQAPPDRPNPPRDRSGGTRRSGPTGKARVRGAGGGALWLYGRHAALAALANPTRRIERVCLTPQFQESAGEAFERLAGGAAWRAEILEPARLDRLVGDGAAHQGLIVAARPLDQPDVAELRPADAGATVVVLDQASDPRNIGAVIRAAAAFGASAVVTTQRGAPPETGALAKAAAGTLEHTPYIQATNLARALETLKANGFWTVGLDGQATTPLAAAPFDRPTALVMGAEGRGLRRLTAENCDALARIPIAAGVESLNVATAAAIALYERRRAFTTG